MSTSTLSAISAHGSSEPRVAMAVSPWLLRSLLIFACLASVSAAAVLGEPAIFVRVDPELAFLLRGMAAIKGAIVLSAVAVLLWRFGHTVSNRAALAYISGCSVLAGSSMLVWQLSFIAFAALAFHLALFVILMTAWRDGGTRFSRLRRTD